MTELEKEKIYKIAEKLGKGEILCQLSEECSELIQACLKYNRATKGLTPKTKEEVCDNLFEEMADVLLIIEQIVYLFREYDSENIIQSIQSYKGDRWWKRTFISQNKE